jgi:hypothetical protein
MFKFTESYLNDNLFPFLDPSSPLPKSSESILQEILQLLLKDGLKCNASSQQKNYLRRLGEAAAGSTSYAENIILVLICLICAALASGLTQGLLSLDLMEMTIKARSGTQKERIYASMVIPVITRHHLLLVTLMLWNAVANEALPVFLQKLVPEWLAIVLSVTMVLFVGEIIPAAVLTGPNQLMIAAKLLPLVYAVMGVFFIVAYPISLALDFGLGHDEGLTMYNRKEITTMMKIQHEVGVRKGRSRRDTVQQEEVQIVGGALKFSDMYVRDVMTPSDKVFMLASSERLTYKVTITRCSFHLTALFVRVCTNSRVCNFWPSYDCEFRTQSITFSQLMLKFLISVDFIRNLQERLFQNSSLRRRSKRYCRTDFNEGSHFR